MTGALLSLVLAAAASGAEARAVDFLAKEVPAWPRDNGCFSCHNNGDAARALVAASRAGFVVPEAALADTLRFLTAPGKWGEQKGEEAFSDEVLARIQFASALTDAIDAGLVANREPLRAAAALVASDQSEDGSWRLDASGSIGSPATYGRVLATAKAREVLLAADADGFAEVLARTDGYLRSAPVRTVLDAASVLLGLGGAGDDPALAQRERALAVIREGQAPSGGFGPYVSSREEPFDTALVLLALAAAGEQGELLEKGRQFLLERQLEDGSWVETTRPAGQTSYAQYISTTGWALLALVATRANE